MVLSRWQPAFKFKKDLTHALLPNNRYNAFQDKEADKRMHWNRESLITTLQRAIQQIATQKGEPLARSIAPIVMTNLDKGRVHHFLDGQTDNQPEAYAWRVCKFYEKWHPYLTQIQLDQDPELWLALYNQLRKWSYHHLMKQGFSAPHDQKLQLATDCATMAAVRLLHARFPYDTDFNPWAHVLVQNVTRKYLHQEYTASREEAKHLQPVADWEEMEKLLSRQLFTEAQFDKVNLRQALLFSIEQLASDARKQLIILHYFDGLPLAEIAREMGRSSNAVHKLHHDALRNLRKIWEDQQDNYE